MTNPRRAHSVLFPICMGSPPTSPVGWKITVKLSEVGSKSNGVGNCRINLLEEFRMSFRVFFSGKEKKRNEVQVIVLTDEKIQYSIFCFLLMQMLKMNLTEPKYLLFSSWWILACIQEIWSEELGQKVASSTQFWWFNKENKIQLKIITKVVPVF